MYPLQEFSKLDKALESALSFLGKVSEDAKYRLHDIDVEEISLVDRAANKRKFLVVKRSESMTIENQEKVQDPSEAVQPVEQTDGQSSEQPSGEPSVESVEQKMLVLPTPVKEALIRTVTEAVESLVSVGNQIKEAEETTEQIDTPMSAELAREIGKVADMLRGALSKYPSPNAKKAGDEDAEDDEDSEDSKKAKGKVAATLKEIGEIAMSLAQATGETDELGADALKTLQRLSAKLGDLAGKYPSPMAGKAKDTDEDEQEEADEKSLDQAPIGVGDQDQAKAIVSDIGKQSPTQRADEIMWAVQRKISDGAMMDEKEKNAVETILTALGEVVKGVSVKRAAEEQPLPPKREEGDMNNIGHSGPSSDKALLEDEKSPLAQILKRLDNKVGTLQKQVNDLAEIPQVPASRHEPDPPAVQEGAGRAQSKKTRWVF